MPDLEHTLNGYDFDLVKIIADKWGMIDLPETQDALIKHMVLFTKTPEQYQQLESGISSNARQVLLQLHQAGGKMPFGLFVRKFGELREMGPARRSREKPYQTPNSVTEELWYMGFIGRAFLDDMQGLQEYLYIPEDWMPWIPKTKKMGFDPRVLLADPIQYRVQILVDDNILDDLTSCLIALRTGASLEDLGNEIRYPSMDECITLLRAAGLLDVHKVLNSEKIRLFLSSPRDEALSVLFHAWFGSTEYNDLNHVPGLILEGTWKNDPIKTREMLVGQLSGMDDGEWQAIKAFLSHIKDTNPAFQRPSGDFDSWTIASRKTGASMVGFQNWDEVDGALIRHIICGPLHWLGLVDLGTSQRGHSPEAFRLSQWARDIIASQPLEGSFGEGGRITVMRNGKVCCPRKVPRTVRYQLARFCLRCDPDAKGYQYILTHASLERALAQGLQVEQLLALLQKNSLSGVPQSLLTALLRWENHGAQISMSDVVLLKFTDPAALEDIRKSNLGRFLGEIISPTSATVSASGAEKLVPRLLELGYFCDLQAAKPVSSGNRIADRKPKR